MAQSLRHIVGGIISTLYTKTSFFGMTTYPINVLGMRLSSPPAIGTRLFLPLSLYIITADHLSPYLLELLFVARRIFCSKLQPPPLLQKKVEI